MKKLDRNIIEKYLHYLRSEFGEYPVIKRNALGRRLVRDWALNAGYTFGPRGPMPEQIYMDWIDTHMIDKVKVIDSGFYNHNGSLRRRVRVHCVLCADIHTFDAQLGLRGNLGLRITACIYPYNVAINENCYEVIDNTPMSNWESENAGR